MASDAAALAYHEPGIITILILSSFLLLQNAINWAFDRLLYCGLIGQIIVGVAWGKPGADWLSEEVQNTIMQIGYLGLILLVMEGGLSTDLKTLKSNLPLSSLVALIGISAPIGISFVLLGLVNGATPVQAFAAGAALCSTSLGTTFTILSTSGLSASRLGVVLSSAAMMDDIVGLVMSGIIARLGQSSVGFSATSVVRPVLVSVALAVLLPLICLYIIKPATKLCYKIIIAKRGTTVHEIIVTEHAAVLLHTLTLAALVAAASYAGTSVLFAAYLAGAAITWWDGLCHDLRQEHAVTTTQGSRAEHTTGCDSQSVDDGNKQISGAEPSEEQNASSTTTAPRISNAEEAVSTTGATKYHNLTGTRIFEKYYGPPLQTILKPFFFASIGFAIPITQMFGGAVVWRGIVYTILMVVAKLACGLCLVRFAKPIMPTRALRKLIPSHFSGHLPWPIRTTPTSTQNCQPAQGSAASGDSPSTTPSTTQRKAKVQPLSLYPATILGSAMVARGEIGFLISSVAESEGVFGPPASGGSSELFLIVTWAILLCTILGPVVVGLMVKRVKRLQAMERSKSSGREDPLGVWGMQNKKREEQVAVTTSDSSTRQT